MHKNIFFGLISGIVVLATTPAELDSFEIFDFMTDEDFAPPPASFDFIAAYEEYSARKKNAEKELDNLVVTRVVLEEEMSKIRNEAISRIGQLDMTQFRNRMATIEQSRVEVASRIEEQRQTIRDAQIFFQWNRPIIESACRRSIATHAATIQRLTAQRDEAMQPVNRARDLRRIVTTFIQTEYIPAPFVPFSELDEESRTKFLDSVTFYAHNQRFQNEETNWVEILKRSFRQKSYGFLHYWLAALNEHSAAVRTQLAPLAQLLNAEYVETRTQLQRARAIVEELQEYNKTG